MGWGGGAVDGRRRSVPAYPSRLVQRCDKGVAKGFSSYSVIATFFRSFGLVHDPPVQEARG